jgi:hypothetical protein
MMNVIYAIPMELGWAMVGAAAMLLAVTVYNIGKVVLEGRKESEEM